MDKTKAVSNIALIATAAGVCLLSLMMSQQLGWFSFAFVLCCSLYRLWLIDNNNYNASKWLSKLFYLLAIVLVGSSAISGNLIATLLSMLVVAQGLTLLTLKQVRGLYTICWVQFFLTTASMMYLQSMHLAFVLFALNFLILFAIYSVYHPSLTKQQSLAHVHKVAKLVVVALPICLLLFALMPRLPPLWKMPKPPTETRGLQEQLKLGDIARLSRSEELAFRVTFDNQAVERTQMYWRALTLDQFDGETWQQSELKKNITKFAQIKKRDLRKTKLVAQNPTELISYQVIAEASYQPWLFNLDLGFSQDNNVLHMPDFSLIYYQDLRQKLQYSAYSVVNEALTETLNTQPSVSLDAYLQLPAHQSNPKTQAWLQELKQLNTDNPSLIAAVLDYFNQQDFYYTLSPSRLPQPIIDNFLFNTREGFCEHYASAFAYVMRLAGIPSRLVIGYLGGEHNPSGDYFSIYQFDAHAWVEVYLQGQWRRIDPTSYVAPERITQNLQQTLGRDEFLPDSLFSLYHYDQIPLVNDARLLLANIDYQWTRWILNYDINKQKKLLKQLFGDNQVWRTLMLITVVVVTLIVITLIALWLNRHKQAQLYWQIEYRRACKALQYLDIENYSELTPQQILARLQHKPASIKQSWQQICVILDQILYKPQQQGIQAKNKKQLKQAVSKFVRSARKQQ
ncbi:transglutaminaseTgpA domain-containing protein [Catenovulum sp. SX2]|uniref:transglutaminase family protein n=1 Tax=Catenovulum sp. SX2 TaxID=3398614 RepID=UPI003F86D90B